MNIQELLVYLALGIAIGFLFQKFMGKKTRAKGEQRGAKSKKGCGKDDCGCH